MGGAKRNPSVLFVAGRPKELFVTEQLSTIYYGRAEIENRIKEG